MQTGILHYVKDAIFFKLYITFISYRHQVRERISDYVIDTTCTGASRYMYVFEINLSRKKICNGRRLCKYV